MAVLLGALVLAQALGLMHRIAHMPHQRGPVQGWTQLSVSIQADPASAGWLQKLFAGHQHDADCDAYDQLGHGDALKSASPTVASIEFTQAPVALHRGWHIATQSSGFLARGPPSLS